MATQVSRVQGRGRFAHDGTSEKAPRAAAETSGPAAGDTDGRTARGGDHPALWEPLLALTRVGHCAGRRRPRPGGVADGREVGACIHRGGSDGEPLVRAGHRRRLGREHSAPAACRSHGVRNDHARAGDRSPRTARDLRLASGCLLARIRRPRRAGDHAREAPLIPPRRRTRPRRPRACGRVAGNPRAGRSADRIRPVLHASLRRNGRAAGVGVPLRPRHLAPALSRGRAPLLRPAPPCRLGAPTEEEQCRPTSCCPT